MKAGAFTPAIQAAPGFLRPRPDRSMKAGAFTPAIRAGGVVRRAGRRALNEGGGLHPRNPGIHRTTVARPLPRSMKAGAFTPAILGGLPLVGGIVPSAQ